MPEVTFCAIAIAVRRARLQHGAVHDVRHRLLNPLNVAALLTLGAVALSLRFYDAAVAAWAWWLLGAYAVGFLALSMVPAHMRRLDAAILLLLPLLALALIALDPRPGAAPVLLVIWTAVLFADWPARRALPAIVAADVAFYVILRERTALSAPLMAVLIHAGFQVFAALCMHYARSAEHARDALARVNADLLATRALLADSARDAERLRMARELHDVAGHKLTALRLNLRALAADPALAARDEVRIAGQLSAELLGDIRHAVQALRDERGLDIATALRALAAPLPRPALQLAVDDDVQISDAAVAEAVLRLVQEALTNAARHADADVLRVALHRDGDDLQIAIEDDGRVRGVLREGNGITGMRERIDALRGTLRFARTPEGALRIDARLPAVRRLP
nr:histidine kinase [Luteimonas sp. BDR2-5]